MLASVLANKALAQTGKLPPFQMMQASGKIFQAQQLPLGKPIVIIYFDTDCDHCHQLMKQLMRHTAALQKASVAMITYLPVEKLTKFAAQYNLQQYPNIYVGTEGTTFFVKNYYRLSSLPFMALYTKNGDLVKTFPNEDGLTDLLSQLKALP